MTRLTDTKGFDLARDLFQTAKIKTLEYCLLYDFANLVDCLNKNNPTDVLILCKTHSCDGCISEVRILHRQSRLSQFDTCHTILYTIENSYADNIAIYHVPPSKVESRSFAFEELSQEEALSLLKSWDSRAERWDAPTNDGQYLYLDPDKYSMDRHLSAMSKARENGSISTLIRCFTNLAHKIPGRPSNQRAWIYPCDDGEYGFVLKRIDENGEWHKIYNGGIIYHRSTNSWSTHT